MYKPYRHIIIKLNVCPIIYHLRVRHSSHMAVDLLHPLHCLQQAFLFLLGLLVQSVDNIL